MDSVDKKQGRILITGGTGQVGGALCNELQTLAEVYAPDRDALDLTNPSSIRNVVNLFRPTWIVNAAAYTAVDKAERERDLAFAINSRAVSLLAEQADEVGAAFIHFSTDYVFDGQKPVTYVEEDSPRPLGVYGESKLQGEHLLAQSGVSFCILRTSWVYGATGRNFLRTILAASQKQAPLRIVADQRGAPTWSRDLARLAAHIIRGREQICRAERCSPAEALSRVQGVFHATASGETTWYGFAVAALKIARGMRPDLCFAEPEAVATSDYPTPSRRPLNSRLNCSKLDRQLGWRSPEWQESLAHVMREIAAETADAPGLPI